MIKIEICQYTRDIIVVDLMFNLDIILIEYNTNQFIETFLYSLFINGQYHQRQNIANHQTGTTPLADHLLPSKSYC